MGVAGVLKTNEMSKKGLAIFFSGILLLIWAFHIWMAYEKGDWGNSWRWSQMGLELQCAVLGWLYTCALLDNSQLQDKNDGN